MKTEELAKILNGRQYGDEITDDEEAAAEESGLIALFGYSDDNAEFRGAFKDEIGCYDGGTILVDWLGVLPEREQIYDDEELEKWFPRKKRAAVIKAIFGGDDYTWSYETKIPHATFEIMEDGEKYCIGIVFSRADLPTQ